MTASSCSWTQYPDRDAAVAAPFEFAGSDDATARQPADALFLLPNGLWAYVTDNPPDLEPGTLAVAAPDDGLGGGHHLFAVVTRARWGLQLQRLDTESFDEGDTDTWQLRAIGEVGHLQRTIDLNVDACVVEERLDEADCLRDAPAGTRWALYPTGDEGRLTRDRTAGAMPVPRSGIAASEPGEAGLQVAGLPDGATGRWLAVAVARAVRPIADVTIAADPSCRVDRSRTEAFGVHLVEREVPAADHPVRVTDAAYQFGADALVDCRSGTASLMVPTLFRRPLATRNGTTLGPPILGARSVLLDGGGAVARTLAAAALAHLAVGDPITADLAAEQAIRRGARGEEAQLLLGAMQVAAAAGRPEAAYRRGQRASHTDWNRDNNPVYLVGRAAAEAAVGKTRRFYGTRESAVEAAERVDRSRLVAWLEWSGRLRKAVAGQYSAEDLRRYADDATGDESVLWRAATLLLATRQDVPIGALPLGAAVERRLDLGALPAGLRGEDVRRACEDGETCPFDVYGRRFADALATAGDATGAVIDRTRRMGRAVFQPGFAQILGQAFAETRDALALFAAIAPDLDRRARGELVDGFDRRMQATIADAIRDGQACDPSIAVAIRERLTLEGHRVEHPHGRILVMDWLLNGEGRRVCSEPARAARSLVALAADDPEMRRFSGPIFPVLVERAEDSETRRAVVEHAAEFAGERRMAESCKRWRLALAAASARSGDHREADNQLEAAVNCGADATYDRAESILIAFTAFMRSGGLPRRIDSRLEPDLQRLVRQRVDASCVGLADFDYNLAAALPDEIVELANTLKQERSPGDGILTIQSTHDNLTAAVEGLAEAKRAFGEGDFATASSALATARETFTRIEHAPGIAQVQFLTEVFVSDAVDEQMQAEASAGEVDDEPQGRTRIAKDCELDSDKIPASVETRRCLLADHGVARLADTWSNLAGELESADEKAFLAGLFLLDGREAALQSLADGGELSLCRQRRD